MKMENTSFQIARVGKKAPNFEVPVYFEKKFATTKLSDHLGKWVMLYFHPGDFTFICGTELSDLTNRFAELTQMGVEVISFSVDNLYVHKVWNDIEISKIIAGGIPFRMASDTAGKVGKMYGVYDEELGLNLRGRFIIDPDGVIQTVEILNAPVGRSVSEAIRQIKAFQLVRNSHGTEACPAGWQPGQPTIKPSTDLVGSLWKVWKITNE
jgi:peroxiredoxin (alkyl hydroperoxide reductase subunit C)